MLARKKVELLVDLMVVSLELLLVVLSVGLLVVH